MVTNKINTVLPHPVNKHISNFFTVTKCTTIIFVKTYSPLILIKKKQKQKTYYILEALHIRNIQPKLNRINFETNVNVLKCLLLLTLFIETNSKSKCYTIQHCRRSSY